MKRLLVTLYHDHRYVMTWGDAQPQDEGRLLCDGRRDVILPFPTSIPETRENVQRALEVFWGIAIWPQPCTVCGADGADCDWSTTGDVLCWRCMDRAIL